ncbi:hypothetical protein COCOBI_02-6510 [Coccomyxa sp. Obi]|nr:hypothetical protein COCOBI_02-6510 [Coccomyxa sp. Obi]
MVFPHEETVSRDEGRRLAKERYHKIHSLGITLRARKNLNPAFEAMAADASPAESGEIKVNKWKNYVLRRIVKAHRGYHHAVPGPKKRINPTQMTEAREKERFLLVKAMRFIFAVEKHAKSTKNVPMLRMGGTCGIDDVAMHATDGAIGDEAKLFRIREVLLQFMRCVFDETDPACISFCEDAAAMLAE